MKEKEILEKIAARKRELGDQLLILTHHYQRKEIVELGDFRGDSFGLAAQAASDENVRYIVFCGVHFMAESAAILAKPHQIVQIPDETAGCWMVDMADAFLLERAWKELTGVVQETRVVPLVYMNSDAYTKAHCGRNNGAVCTSSNAPRAFEWALERGEKIFFFPDEHLGRNTANRLGIRRDETIVWNPHKPLGGNSEEKIKKARLILWKSFCLVHTRFTVADVTDMRQTYPEAKIVVHPECTEDVVARSDAAGSTSFIVNYVKNAEKGASIIVATEVNLVKRLDAEHPDKTVLPLRESVCPNMYKINPRNLLFTLDNIGKVNVVSVDEKVRQDAGKALDRMLALR